MVLSAGEDTLYAEVTPPIALRQTAAPVIAEIFYSVPAQPLGELFPKALPGDCVIIRDTGKLYLFNGKSWQDTTPEQGFAAVNRSTGSWLRWRGIKWEVIATSGSLNVRDYGARGDYAPFEQKGTDDSAAIQAALDEAGTIGAHQTGRVVYLPAGRYLVSRPLNLATDLEKNRHSHITVRGDGVEKSLIYGATGGVLLDCTGSVTMGFEDFSVYTCNVPHPATVAFLFARGVKNPWAIRYRITNVWVHMHSDAQALGGVGTVGIWNFGGEHHTYTDLWIEANLPVVLTRIRRPEGLPDIARSPYVAIQDDGFAVSQHLTSVLGTSVLCAYDYHRPCLLVNRVAEVHLLGTYMSARPWPHRDLPKGRCLYAVEALNVFQYVHHGLLEVPGIAENGKLTAGYGYLRNTLDLDQADIRVLLAPAEKLLRDNGRELVVPAIDATPIMDLPSGILNSQIDVRYPPDCDRFPETAVYIGQTPFAAKVALCNSTIVATAAAVDLIPEELRSKAKSLVTYDYRSHVSREYGLKDPSPAR